MENYSWADELSFLYPHGGEPSFDNSEQNFDLFFPALLFPFVYVRVWVRVFFSSVIVGYLSNRFTMLAIRLNFFLPRVFFKNVWPLERLLILREHIMNIIYTVFWIQPDDIFMFYGKWTKLAGAHWINRLKYGSQPYQLRKLLAVSSIFWNTSKQWAWRSSSFTLLNVGENKREREKEKSI